MTDQRPPWAARIRAERKARSWPAVEMTRRLRDAADDRTRAELPTLTSLVSYVRRWERGATGISERHRLLYAAAFEMDEGELFGTAYGPVPRNGGPITPDEEERLVAAARAPSRLDARAVDSLATVLAEQRLLEDHIGSEPLVEPVRAQLATLERLVTDARGPVRSRVLDVAAQWAQFAGWLHTTTGRLAEAYPMYDRALEWTTEADDPNMIATALSMKGHAAWVAGKAGPVVGLSQAAQRSSAASPGVRALAAQQEARGYAMMGEGDSTDRKLDAATTLILLAAEHREDEPAWVYFFNPDFLGMQRHSPTCSWAGTPRPSSCCRLGSPRFQPTCAAPNGSPGTSVNSPRRMELRERPTRRSWSRWMLRASRTTPGRSNCGANSVACTPRWAGSGRPIRP
ncbi:MAG: helix-turn-helix domain-containing protein [Streptomycetales bacterium]